MRYGVIFLLMCFCFVKKSESQEIYNNCSNAFEVCPNTSYSLNNIGANATFCPGCEDDFNYCFPTDNTIWLSFTTNATGGDVQVDISNLAFSMGVGQDTELQATIIEAVAPCVSTSYTQIGTCISNATGNFSLNALALTANTLYYIVIDGDNSGPGITSAAECTFDLIISGTGIDRPTPSATINTTTPNSCLNDIVTFTSTITDCPDNGDFEWYINGSLVATTTTPTFQTSALNDGDIVSVKTPCYLQCVDTAEAFAPAQSVFTINVNAGSDITIQEGEDIQLFGSSSAPTFEWTPSFLVNSNTILNPIASPTETTTFTLTATENGCSLSDDVTIFIATDLEIPNTFSPNGDGNNDAWIINGIEKYPDNSVVVFNRWGQKVFSATGYSKSKAWDGSIKSGNAAEGVYYYVIDFRDDSEEVRNGSLTIIR